MDSGDQKSASSAASGSFFSAIASSVRSWGSAMQKSVNGYGGAADLSFFFLVSLSNRIGLAYGLCRTDVFTSPF
ncbi:hypothetical protein BHM03_00005337 [Ensete ventricosum]|nr:hypothetical protein BHM03_00005337 [Ensete ventricosum]